MKRLRICIDIPGDVYQGLDSPGRGESRWAMNWAKFLATEGHEVICVCYPEGKWGPFQPFPNCELKAWATAFPIECDIYINCVWWKGRNVGEIKAKTYIHMCYGFESHLADPEFITNGHVIAYPYEQSASKFIGKHNPFVSKTFCLPVPLAENFSASAFNNKTLTFSAKDVFLDRHYPKETYWFQAGRDTLKAIVSLGNKYQLDCAFMMAHEIIDTNSKAVLEYKTTEILQQANSAQYFKLLNMEEVYKLLAITKVLTPVISPGGSMIEGVTRGIVPLTWVGSLFDSIAKEENFLLQENVSEYKDIEQNLERLILDKVFYDHILSRYQNSLSGHLHSNSRKYFNQVIDFKE